MEETSGLIVGENSFIAKSINDFFTFDKCTYKEFLDTDLSPYNVVLNCALNPLYKISPYEANIDVDYQIGKKVCDLGIHYVMLSTSKVYGQCNELQTYTEESELDPFDYYSENKIISEQKLLQEFSDKVTILRGSNIFGFEYGRNSFMGYCMSQLVNEGKVILTMSEKTKRDFIFVNDAADIITEACLQRPTGIYNLSSNYGLEIGRIIESLIHGYVYGGKMIKKSDRFERQFILDNTKIKKKLGIEIGPYPFEKICYRLGQQLCKI